MYNIHKEARTETLRYNCRSPSYLLCIMQCCRVGMLTSAHDVGMSHVSSRMTCFAQWSVSGSSTTNWRPQEASGFPAHPLEFLRSSMGGKFFLVGASLRTMRRHTFRWSDLNQFSLNPSPTQPSWILRASVDPGKRTLTFVLVSCWESEVGFVWQGQIHSGHLWMMA